MMFSGKPSLIYTNNLNQYLENERGLYISIKELPFMLSSSENELCENISRLADYEEEYQNKVKEFVEKMGAKEHGNSCEKIYKIIKDNLK